jgi:glycosyltransferase involved in cell wall biosynthesis
VTIRVLHLIDQLTRGGAGRALLGVAGASRDLHHTIGSLRAPEEGARRLAVEAGIEVLHLRDEEIDAAEDRRGGETNRSTLADANRRTIADADHPTIADADRLTIAGANRLTIADANRLTIADTNRLTIADANRLTIADAIDAADIVHVHFWNSPSLYRALGRSWPAARVLTWCHVGGDEPPQILTAGLVDFSDVILASNPHTAELPVLARANAEGRGGMVLGTADFSRLKPGLTRSNPCFTITHIGTVDFVKMHPDFVALHAGLDIDDYRIVVCGVGAALPVLQRQAAEAGCADRFEFRGYVEAVDEVFAESDIFAYPIGDGYASELVLQEAMFCGVPPVVMTTGGPTRMVRHEDTGLLARTPADYRSALERLAREPEFRTEMGARAAAHAKAHWGAERSAAQLVGWYEKLMGRPKRLRTPLGEGRARSGADHFLVGLGASASQFRVSRNAEMHPRATVLAADRLISASSPLLASGASGGVLHYRLEFPGDPHLHYWSGLVLARAGRPALAAAEFAAARRCGFDPSRLEVAPGPAGPDATFRPAEDEATALPPGAEARRGDSDRRVGAATPVAATSASPTPDWLVPREQWGSLVDVLRARPCTVAVLGCSVSAQRDGYLPMFQRWLEDWTGHRHTHVNAGFGGVGSFGAVFLMDRHVVARRPDVCFVECTTGDMASSVVQTEVSPVVEGILRKLRGLDCRIGLLHLYRGGRQQTGIARSVVERYEKLADHYGAASLHLDRVLADEMAAGRLDRDRLFRDGLHTRAEGAFTFVRLLGEALASGVEPGAGARHVPIDSFTSARTDPPTDPRAAAVACLPPAMHGDHYGSASIESVDPGMMVDGRPVAAGTFRFLYPFLDVPEGSTMRIPPRAADLCGLLLVVGPHGGWIDVRTREIFHRYDSRDEWTHFERLHTLAFRAPLPMRSAIDITPVSGSMKIVGLLTRPFPPESRF